MNLLRLIKVSRKFVCWFWQDIVVWFFNFTSLLVWLIMVLEENLWLIIWSFFALTCPQHEFWCDVWPTNILKMSTKWPAWICSAGSPSIGYLCLFLSFSSLEWMSDCLVCVLVEYVSRKRWQQEINHYRIWISIKLGSAQR